MTQTFGKAFEDLRSFDQMKFYYWLFLKILLRVIPCQPQIPGIICIEGVELVTNGRTEKQYKELLLITCLLSLQSDFTPETISFTNHRN